MKITCRRSETIENPVDELHTYLSDFARLCKMYRYLPLQSHASSLFTVQIIGLHVKPLSFRCRLKIIRDKVLIKHQASDHELATRSTEIALRRRNIIRRDHTLAFTGITVAVALLAALLPELFGRRWEVEVRFVERVVGGEGGSRLVAACCCGDAAVRVWQRVCDVAC